MQPRSAMNHATNFATNHAMDLSRLRPGFAAPVQDAQTCFRRVLDALARPGRVLEIDVPIDAPAGLSAAQTAVLLSLADQDTPVWLNPDLREHEAGDFLRFHCGCILAATTDAATFIVLPGLDALPDLDTLALGEPRYPDRSSTLLIEVAAFDSGQHLQLSGPGIAGTQLLQVDGWTARATAFMQENRRRFPLGVDLLLCAGRRIVGLPRTVRITEELACTSQ